MPPAGAALFGTGAIDCCKISITRESPSGVPVCLAVTCTAYFAELSLFRSEAEDDEIEPLTFTLTEKGPILPPPSAENAAARDRKSVV